MSVNLKSNMDRFIGSNGSKEKAFALYLKSNMDRFIANKLRNIRLDGSI